MGDKKSAPSRKASLIMLEKSVEHLSDETLTTLVDFAAFLQQKYPAKTKLRHSRIKQIPRPEEESVIAAIKRLTKTYPMLDKKLLFEQTSIAMSAHVMQNVPSEQSIDRLELVFKDAYETFNDKQK